MTQGALKGGLAVFGFVFPRAFSLSVHNLSRISTRASAKTRHKRHSPAETNTTRRYPRLIRSGQVRCASSERRDQIVQPRHRVRSIDPERPVVVFQHDAPMIASTNRIKPDALRILRNRYRAPDKVAVLQQHSPIRRIPRRNRMLATVPIRPVRIRKDRYHEIFVFQGPARQILSPSTKQTLLSDVARRLMRLASPEMIV